MSSQSMKIIGFIFVLFFLLLPSEVLAVTVNIHDYPTVISSDSFNLGFTVTGASEGQNYLRVDMFKDGTTNYFGETFNGNDWYEGSEGKSYFPISIDSSKIATASVQTRIGSPNSSEFPGPGLYKLKLRRYTASGNPASSDQQAPVDIQINVVLPTVVPTPAPTSKPSTAKATAAPSKTSVMKDSGSTYPSIKIKESFVNPDISRIMPTSVLGEATDSAIITADANKENEAKILGESEKKVPMILLTSAVILFVCGILAFLWFRRRYAKEIQ